MNIADFIAALEMLAPPVYQESYDNAGLQTGDRDATVSGVLLCLDVTEAVLQEAVQKNCNLVVSHHPLIFRGLKQLTGRDSVERTVIAAIKQDVAIYAIHTNLDNVFEGVNGAIADKLGLINCSILVPRAGTLQKLYTFVPAGHLDAVRDAVFAAGAGHIGNYSESAFASEGTGSFKPGVGARPFLGETGIRHYEQETKLEFIYPAHLQRQIVQALVGAHPYEEVAYDIMDLANSHRRTGSGLIGELPEPALAKDLLEKIKNTFRTPVIRHTALSDSPIRKVAVCGGAGSFLIPNALAAGAGLFVTADVKYHSFFEAEGRMVIADIGHFESEQFTIDLLDAFLKQKFPNFAVLKTSIHTNPVHYLM